MKQICFQLVFLLCGLTAYGQDVLDFRMLDAYKGKVKSIVVTSPEQMQSEAEFSIDGKITRMKNSMFQVDYEWNGDEELKLIISNSNESQTFFIYINEYRKDYYEYEMGDSNMKIWFRDNGSLQRKELTQNGNIVAVVYYYNSDTDLYPYKIVSTTGTQSQVNYINVEKCDSEGNAIVFTQACNGVSMQIKRNISYYK